MERGGEKGQEEDQDDDNSGSGNESLSSSREQSEDKEPTKPPAKSQEAKKRKQSKDPDEGKEGTTDDIPIPCKMEARCMEREPGGRPTARARAGSRINRSASKSARSAGDFGTPQKENARRIMLVCIGSQSPGCSFPWA